MPGTRVFFTSRFLYLRGLQAFSSCGHTAGFGFKKSILQRSLPVHICHGTKSKQSQDGLGGGTLKPHFQRPENRLRCGTQKEMIKELYAHEPLIARVYLCLNSMSELVESEPYKLRVILCQNRRFTPTGRSSIRPKLSRFDSTNFFPGALRSRWRLRSKIRKHLTVTDLRAYLPWDYFDYLSSDDCEPVFTCSIGRTTCCIWPCLPIAPFRNDSTNPVRDH